MAITRGAINCKERETWKEGRQNEGKEGFIQMNAK